MAVDNYVSVYLLNIWEFNLLFVVEWFLGVVATSFMLFYWNRMVGSLLSLSLRWYFWHYHKTLVKVQSFQISLLAGRLFFKNFTYVGSNESITILQGSFTWRYWLHRRRLSKYKMQNELDSQEDEPETETILHSKKLIPSRLKLAIEGVEWYIYNRSPAFDIIEENLKKHASESSSSSSSDDKEDDDNNSHKRAGSSSSDTTGNDAGISGGESQDLKSKEANLFESNYFSGNNPSSNPADRDQQQNMEDFHTSRYGKFGALISHLRSIKETARSSTERSFSGRNSTSDPSDANQEPKSQPQHNEHRVLLTHGDTIMLKLLPIDLKMTKGAVIVGNKTTPSLLVFQFASGTGYIDAEKAKSQFDKYKMAYHGDLIKPIVEMKPNIGYEENHEYHREIMRMTQKFQFSKITVSILNFFSKISQLLKNWKSPISSHPTSSGDDSSSIKSQGPNAVPWRGLDRYKIDTDNEMREMFQKDPALSGRYYPEYARVTTILDASEGSLTLYYDAPGPVPRNPGLYLNNASPDSDDFAAIKNGGPAPEWGLDLYFKEVTIHYGPWSDRQRIALQRVLVPLNCFDSTPQTPLNPGDTRLYTEFKVNVKLDKNSIVRLPTREVSKNTQFYTANEDELNNKQNDMRIVRPFGWIEITASDFVNVDYTSAMVATEAGWKTTFNLDISKFEVRTSVNHALLYSAKTLKVNADLSAPLQWNGLQTWSFLCNTYEVDCFIMREHIFLLADLMSDFSEGPSTPYDLFSPCVYKFHWHIHNGYKINLNINDLNIINNPLDISENIYIIFSGDTLKADVTVPLDQIFQKKNTVSFDVSTPRFDLGISSPPWNTLHSFLNLSSVGRAYDTNLKGSYTYHANVDAGYSDTLILETSASDVTLLLYGFVIKYLMKIRENYFGEHTHFQTFEEFAQKDKDHPDQPEFTHVKSDIDLDVIFHVYLNNGSVVLPANIYSAESNILLNFASFDIDVRFTNYYMDLQANISPVKGIHNSKSDLTTILDSARDKIPFDPIIFIDGIFIHGNRVFGLPPTEPTYFCKWDFDLGDILLNGPLEILQYLGNVGSAIGYTYSDTENSLLITEPTIYDVTYLSLNIASLKYRLNVSGYILEAITNQISLNYNDLNNNRYSARLTISIPQIQAKVLKKNEPSPGDSTGDEDYEILALLRTSILITDFIQKRGFYLHHERQQQHIALHDAPFDRCSFLLDEYHRTYHEKPMGNIIPSIPLPTVPPPLTTETAAFIDPNLSGSFGTEANGADTSSVSSKSKYSSSGSSSSEPDDDNDDEEEHDDDDDDDDGGNNSATPRSVRFKLGGSTFAGNAFMPPESWEKFEKISREFNCPLPKFDLNPTSCYNGDEGIAPHFELDSSTEYDSFIIQLGDLTGFLVPKSFLAISELLSVKDVKDLQSTMDSIQIDVLNRLNAIRTAQPEVKNFKIAISSINLKYGVVTGTDANKVLARYNGEVNHLAAECESINISLRVSEKRLPQVVADYLSNGMQEIPKNLTAFAACEKVTLSVVRGTDGVNINEEGHLPGQYFRPISLQLDSPDFWWCETDKQNTGFFHLKNINLSVLSESIPFVSTFIQHNIDSAQSLNFEAKKLQSHTVQMRNAYVIGLLSTAGEIFHIEDDPSVLTRPALITRSAPHVRSNDSWKIMMRLRHVLKSVPSDWKARYDRVMLSNTYTVNADVARREATKVFKKWRSWELTGMEDSYVFRHVFKVQTLQDTLLSKNASINIDLESIAVRLNYLEDENFLCFNYLKLSFGWKGRKLADSETNNSSVSRTSSNVGYPPSNVSPPLELDCTSNCGSVKLHLDSKILKTIEEIDTVILDIDKKYFRAHGSLDEQLPKSSAATSSRPNHYHTPPSSSPPPIKLSVTCCFQNISLFLDFIAFALSYDSRDISFTGNISKFFVSSSSDDIYLDMSIASHIKEIRVGLHDVNGNNAVDKSLFSFLLKDFKSSFATTGLLQTSLKYVTLSHESMAIVIDTPIKSIADAGLRFFENGVERFKSCYDTIEKNHKSMKEVAPREQYLTVPKAESISPVGTTALSSKSSPFNFPVVFRCYGKDLSIRVNGTESVSLYLAIGDIVMASKITNKKQLVFEVSITDDQLELLSRNAQTKEVRSVASVSVPTVTGLVLFEEFRGNNFIEGVINVASIEARMMTVSSLLLMIRSNTIENEVSATVKSIETLTSKITEYAEKWGPAKSDIVSRPVLKSKKKSGSDFFNLTLSIIETQVIIPSFDSSLALKLFDINMTLSSFYYDMQLREFNVTPFFGDFNVNDAILDLRNDTWGASSVPEIVNFQLSVSYSGRDEATNKQRIDISSSRVHIVLCKRILEKLTSIVNSLEEGISDFYPARDAPGSSGSTDTATTSLDETVKEQFRALKKLGEKTLLRMSFSDFCFAWLFEEELNVDQYPISPESRGILFGYTSLQISTSDLAGKTILSGVYITPIDDEESIFTSSADRTQSMNTAYLPSVKVSFFADLTHSSPHVSVNLIGESLRVTILPSIVGLVVCLAKNLRDTADACQRSKSAPVPTTTATTSVVQFDDTEISEPAGTLPYTSTDPGSSNVKFTLPLSFRFSVSFDGATIVLYKDSPNIHVRRISRDYHFAHEMGDAANSKSPDNDTSIFLQTPAVKAKIEYLKGENALKRDAFNAEILITSSVNTIYPRVVPPVVEMWRLVQTVVKHSTLAASKDAVNDEDFDVASVLSMPESFQNIDIDSQFGNIVVDLSIRLERQEVTLSCEPKAKVAATVSYGEFCINLNSLEDTLRKTTYALSVRLKNFNASLQHIYSRECSGQVTVDDITLFVTMNHNSMEQQTIMVAGKISDIVADINFKQSQDLELFQDIWSPKGVLSKVNSRSSLVTFDMNEAFQQKINPAMIDGAIMRKYRRVTATAAIPWSINFSLVNVKVTVDLGQAVGQATFKLDKLWINSQKFSNWEQNLSLGFDNIEVVSEGRFGGIVALRQIHVATAIMWQRHNGAVYPVPLVQAIMGVESLEARATFDYHSFAVASINALHLSMFNQRDKNFVLNDRLAVVGNCESIHVFATSLAASNVLDLVYTIERIRREALDSYNAILRDSANQLSVVPDKQPKKSSATQPFDRLRTFLDVNIQQLAVYIYPDTLMDSQVFTINVQGAEARYSQEIEIHKEFDETSGDEKLTLAITNKEFVSHLDMKLHGLLVALSTSKRSIRSEEELLDMSIVDYIQKSKDPKGTTIIGIPLCEISMATWQAVDTNIIEYIFNSSFGGRVDVGWNLGSINFIRSMWENHVRTFNARKKTYEMRFASGGDTLRPPFNVEEFAARTKKRLKEVGSSSADESEAASVGLRVITSMETAETASMSTKDSPISATSPGALPNTSLSFDESAVGLDSTELSPITSSSRSLDSGSISEDQDVASDDEDHDEAEESPSTVAPAETPPITTPTATPDSQGGPSSTGEDATPPYVYVARVPPVIAQPQLRDMGEATPPVEWIGLHRKKLPSFVHQVIMVPLEKTVEEVDVVYRKVLGRS